MGDSWWHETSFCFTQNSVFLCSPEMSPYLRESQGGFWSSLPSICPSQVALEGVGSGCKPAIFPEVSGPTLLKVCGQSSPGKVVHQEATEGVHRFPPGGSRFSEAASSFLSASFLRADHPLSPRTHIQGESLKMSFSLHCKARTWESPASPFTPGPAATEYWGKLSGPWLEKQCPQRSRMGKGGKAF